MARINTRNVLVVALPLIVVGAIALIRVTPPGDSPGEVVGGSVYLKWKQGSSGAVICQNSPATFCAYGGDTTQLDFENLPGMSKVSVNDGWRIHISSKDPQGEHEDMLVVCSDANCSLDPGDGKTYYARPGFGVVIAKNKHSNELHLHNKNKACPGDDEDPNCDKPVHFRFEFGSLKQQSSSCDTSAGDECRVFIGNRDSVKQFWWRKYIK